MPGYGRQDDLWSQDTDVFEVVTGDFEPSSETRRPAPKRAQRSRNLLIGATAAIAVVVLAVVGVLIGSQLGKKSGTTEAATQSAAPAAPSATSAAAVAPTAAPAAGASLSTVLAWIRAGTPVDAANFHTATATDGTKSDLDVGIAFVSPTKKIQCMTPMKSATSYMHGLACMVSFDNPAPRPASHPHGEWNGDWVDYPGPNAGIGRIAGDPGQFTLGYGSTLAYSTTLTFDAYECRMDQTGLLCADESAGTAVQLSSAGPVPFGCFTRTDATEWAIAYGCGGASATTTTSAPSSAQAVSGKECQTAGQQTKDVNGVLLTCDVAGDAGAYRWLDEGPHADGGPCEQEEIGQFSTAADDSTLLCSTANEGRRMQWGKVTPVSGTHETGESCTASQAGRVAKNKAGQGLFCTQIGMTSSYAWRVASS
ncbi:hypothetical protein ACFXHA_07550 [Nocardia sp. NPDC059240]|uniref:hypothetical protein n=1 Tax=Nocardia sp. NPDC059240 TaxID=3346786 RepID=UPI0036C7D637